MLQQQVSQFNTSVLGSCMERTETAFLDTIRISAGFQKYPDYSQMLPGGGGVERLDCHGVLRHSVHRGAFFHKITGHFLVAEKQASCKGV